MADRSLPSRQEPTLEGTGIPIRAVLGLTAQGRTLDEIVEWSCSGPCDEPRRSLEADDIRAAFAYAANLAGTHRLSHPVRAGIADSSLLGDLSIDEVEAKAASVLAERAVIASGQDPEKRQAEVSDELIRAVAFYGATLVAEVEGLNRGEALGRDTRLGSQLAAEDHALLTEYIAYRSPGGTQHMLGGSLD